MTRPFVVPAHAALVASAVFLLGSGTARATSADDPQAQAAAYEAHSDLYIEERMPAAATCRHCHPRQYEQWSMSQHAYTQLSPIFNSFQAALFKLTNGTNGDFCIRCHNPVGMNLGEPLFISNMDRGTTAREGVTCIACHRVDKALGKISGRLPIIQGDITQPVHGPTGNANLAETLKDTSLKLTTDRKARGFKIHNEAKEFRFLSASGFCGNCHDVTLVDGFRLEEAFSEYKHSPAAAAGTSCQDCHMGKVPGRVSGYDEGPAAIVNGHETPTRKLTDHRFVGPDHSVVHPGFFPHNDQAADLASMREWLLFDWRAGWGTEEFEDALAEREDAGKPLPRFPERWSDSADREEAREIIDVQLERLDEMREARKALLQLAYVLGEPELEQADADGIRFRVPVRNGTDGHNVPTGFTGERLVWLQVDVKDAEGTIIFQSGDLDPNGDVRDLHSSYVHNGELPLDEQLFNLQSPFITRNVHGGEREQILAVNYSPDPLPFLRPDTRPTILTGRTLDARIHKQGIESNGERWAGYSISADRLTGKPPYTAEVRLKAAMVPVNLVKEISVVGFDYGLSARDIADRLVEGHTLVAERSLTIDMEAAK
ncbi:MAG: multiheme c-type cytochrome [Gammaproteobacteria bacterium]